MDSDRPTRFLPVPDLEVLDDWLPRRGVAEPFLLDPACGVGRRAYREVAAVGGEAALLDVRAHPRLAGEVERRTGVGHESPQVIVLVDGRPRWVASHSAVTAAAISRAVAAAWGPAAAPGRR